jgi:4-diphosphocytidyl-2-C-methyl-D-erythritol kinase
MRKLKLFAHAKVNLSLDIIRRLEDGYHEIKSVMQQIFLKDRIDISEIKNNSININSNDSRLPLDQKNIVWKAVNLIREKYNIHQGVSIFIDKAIPLEGGLAGGSSDVASVLIGLNELWKLQLTQDELINYGSMIGFDVCFCIVGGTALVTSKGEKVMPIRTELKLPLLIANPGFGISTKAAFQAVDLSKVGIRLASDAMVKSMSFSDMRGLVENLHNDFESTILATYPQIHFLKTMVQLKGAAGVLLSGSGSSIFGIMNSIQEANNAAKWLRDIGVYAWSGWSHFSD